MAPLTGLQLTTFRHISGRGNYALLKGMPLEALDLSYNKLTDIEFVRGAPLRTININQTQVTDLTPLRGAPLERLQISQSAVTDLSPIRGAKLTYIGLTGYLITDFSPLANMPIDEAECPWVPFLLGKTNRSQFIRSSDIYWRGRLNAVKLERWADVFTVMKLYAAGKREEARRLTAETMKVRDTITDNLVRFERALR